MRDPLSRIITADDLIAGGACREGVMKSASITWPAAFSVRTALKEASARGERPAVLAALQLNSSGYGSGDGYGSGYGYGYGYGYGSGSGYGSGDGYGSGSGYGSGDGSGYGDGYGYGSGSGGYGYDDGGVR